MISSDISKTPHGHAPAKTRYHRRSAAAAAMAQVRRVATVMRCFSGATPSGFEVARSKGSEKGRAALSSEKRKDAKSGRAKPRAASRVSGGELGRRQAGRQVTRRVPLAIRRGVSTSARVSCAAPRPRDSAWLGSARLGAARRAMRGLVFTCLAQITRDVCSIGGEHAAVHRGALTFLPASRDAWKNRVLASLLALVRMEQNAGGGGRKRASA